MVYLFGGAVPAGGKSKPVGGKSKGASLGSSSPTLRLLELLLRQNPYRSRVGELTVGPEHPITFERWKNHHQVNVGVQRPHLGL